MEFPKVTLEVSLTYRHFCGLISDVAKGLSLSEAFQALGEYLGGLWDQHLPSGSETRLVQLGRWAFSTTTGKVPISSPM